MKKKEKKKEILATRKRKTSIRCWIIFNNDAKKKKTKANRKAEGRVCCSDRKCICSDIAAPFTLPKLIHLSKMKRVI